MENRMFRYLEKHYIKKYRVKARYDLSTNDFPRELDGTIAEDYDEQYIPCRRGEIRACYEEDPNRDILYWYAPSGESGRRVTRDYLEKFPDVWYKAEDLGTYDYILYFDAKDIDKLASIVKPNINGARIVPYSMKNLPKSPYSIGEEETSAYINILNSIPKEERLFFSKRCITEYANIIQEEKGKDFNFKEARKSSGLGTKEFIHFLGYWEKFLEYLKSQI